MRKLLVGIIALALATAVLVAKERSEEGGAFAGMIGGTVTEKDGSKLVVEVTKIEKTWKHNKLENPESLVGKKIKIVPSQKAPNVAKYAETLKKGDADHFDVKQDGKVYVWLELTKDQRAKIGVETK